MSNVPLGRVRLAIVAALAVALAGAAPRGGGAQSGVRDDGFVVVVNAANPLNSIAKGDLAKLFTKKARTWSDGTPALPVDLASGSPVRETFTQRVHGKSGSAIASFWQQQIFSGREVPPPEKKTDDEVLDFVRSNRGAVGYVAAGTKPGTGVKSLTISD